MTRERRIKKELEKYYNQLHSNYGPARAWAKIKRLEKELELYKHSNKEK